MHAVIEKLILHHAMSTKSQRGSLGFDFIAQEKTSCFRPASQSQLSW